MGITWFVLVSVNYPYAPADCEDEVRTMYRAVYVLYKTPEESESSHNAIEYSHAVAHMKGVASHLPANQTHTDIRL